jgi:TetR/AcrR family transcriptional repressor of nem operon
MEEISMRRSKADAAESRRQIVAAAARLIRERGPERVSVADVMQDVGMTHGGFYKHFESKDALLAAAISEAFREKLEFLSNEMEKDPEGARASYAKGYLTIEHVEDLATGCPIAGLTADAARSSPQVSDALAAGALATIKAFSRAEAPGGSSLRSAIRSLSMMIGGLTLARAVSDPALCDEILRSVRE